MTPAIQAQFRPRATALQPALAGALPPPAERGKPVELRQSASLLDTERRLAPRGVVVTGNRAGTVDLATVQENLADRLFDALVSLKVAVSQYAMHIPPAARDHLFEQLDDVLNLEDWHEEDCLPQRASFLNFLKWTVYSKHYDWTSIGLSEDGKILCAFRSRNVLLTANFLGDDQVSWTARVQSEAGLELAAGKSFLKSFARHAKFYLDDAY
ncbi:MAG: hypothetical protein K0R61_4127 [Microvirga sp.]|jgi:hypothetical protein|nr:hypothetical protein [Microvirga sp.]